jgi:hypothetical protein
MTTKAGFMNSDGCSDKPKIVIQRRAPLTSTPCLTRRQERRPDHHRDRRQKEEKMASDEVEAVIAEPFGDRRTAGKRQDDAAYQKSHQAGEEVFVDGPPPFGKGGLICAADHQAASPRVSIPSSAATSARNASPRFSKFWN